MTEIKKRFRVKVGDFLLLLFLLCMVWQTEIHQGIKEALILCYSTVIPSLFPFMILSVAWRNAYQQAKPRRFSSVLAKIFPFIDIEHFIHKPVVESGNVITGIGMFYREFAETVMKRLGYDVGENFMNTANYEYSEENLTFYWTEAEYQEFLEELKEFED